MKPPFAIIARPAYRLHPCQHYLDERDRGLIGFHNTARCPYCRTTQVGWDLHGENGHLQGHLQSVDPEVIALATAARSTRYPVTITVSESGYTYLDSSSAVQPVLSPALLPANIDRDALPDCRREAYTYATDTKATLYNGRHLDLFALYKGQWHYITTAPADTVTLPA